MAIEEVVDISVDGIGQVEALGAAFEAAGEKYDALEDKLKSGFGMSSAGPDKLAASWDAGFAKIGAAADEFLSGFQAKLDGLGAGGAGGLDKLAASVGAAKDKVLADIDEIAAGSAKLDGLGAGAAGSAGPLSDLDDALKGVAGSAGDAAAAAGPLAGKFADIGAGAGAAAGPAGDLGDAFKAAAEGASILDGSLGSVPVLIKGVGNAAGMSAADLLEFNAAMKETAAIQADIAKGSADVTVAAGKSSAIYAEALPSLGTTSIEQDAGVAQAQQARKIASQRTAQQAAADADAAEVSAGRYHLLALGAAAAVGYGIDLAAKLQTGVTRLYTSAGESQANLPMISQGILSLSGQTDQSQASLLGGAYYAESGNYHGQDALAVLRSAAEGSKAEGADTGDVANALTTVLTDYYGGPAKSPKAQQGEATSAMNAIIAAVGQGKMTLQDLSTALPQVLPTAKTAKLSIGQTLGAVAQMTSEGATAQGSAENIRHTIGAIQGPSGIQSAELQMLGINPNQLSHDLGKQGLTGSIAEVDQAIKSHMGPGGMLLLSTMSQSRLAVQSANQEIAAMPPNIRGAAKAYLDGSIGVKAWNQEVRQGGESARDANLLKQFSSTAGTALGYSTLEKEGLGNKQTVLAALKAALGGQVGAQVAQMLGGDHMDAFKAKVDAVGGAAKHTGENIQGWSAITKTLGFQLGAADDQAKAIATEAGQVVAPAVTDALKGVSAVTGFLSSNPAITKPLVETAGVLGAVAIGGKVASTGATALASVGKVAETLHIPGLDKLANIGKGTSGAGGAAASGGLDKVAGSADAASAALDKVAGAGGAAAAGEDAAGAAGDKAAIGESAAGAAGGKAALGEDAAGAAGAKAAIGEDAAGAGGLKAGGTLGAIGTAAIGLMLSKVIIDALEDPKHPSDLVGTSPNSPWNKFPTPTNHNNSIAGEIIGGWDKAAGSVPAAPDTRFQSRFGINVPGAAVAPAAPVVPVNKWSAAFSASNAAGSPEMRAKIPAPDMSALDSAKSKAMSGGEGIQQAVARALSKPVKFPALDMSAFTTAKGKVTSDMAGISRAMDSAGKKPVKIAAPDMSALDAAKGKALSAGEGIQQAAQTAVSKPVHAAAPDLGAYAAAKGPAEADGVAISAGLAQGITAGGGAAVSAAEGVANQVAAVMAKALDTHSPSKVTEKIGTDTSAGLAKGIKDGKDKVKDSALTLSAATITSITEGLQGGKPAVDAAMQAISGKGSRPQDITTIIATISTLKGDVTKALADKQITKPQDSALTKLLERDNTKLQALSAQRTVIEQEIADSQQIAQSAISNASIMNATSATPADPSQAISSTAIIQGMKVQATQAEQFAQQVGQLQKEGLNATSLNQIVQSGAASGSPVAQSLISGGKSAITQVNAIEGQIKGSAAKLGNSAGPAMYQAGVQAAQGLAAGLKSDLSGIDSAIASMAKALIADVEKELKIKSPSLVMRDLGVFVPAGLAQGIDANSVVAETAASRMAARVAAAGKPSGPPGLSGSAPGLSAGAPGLMPGMAGSPSGIGGGGTQIHYHDHHVTVQGSVTNSKNLARELQAVYLTQAQNNTGGGLQLAGRNV